MWNRQILPHSHIGDKKTQNEGQWWYENSQEIQLNTQTKTRHSKATGGINPILHHIPTHGSPHLPTHRLVYHCKDTACTTPPSHEEEVCEGKAEDITIQRGVGWRVSWERLSMAATPRLCLPLLIPLPLPLHTLPSPYPSLTSHIFSLLKKQVHRAWMDRWKTN